MTVEPSDRQRWVALAVLCLGALMIVIDVTIVNVALPSIGADLGVSDESLTWVVNGYLLVFGGFLLLGGRLGDLYGARRVLAIGIAAFALASLACGLAPTPALLVAARAVQGLGGAVVDSVSLALIVGLFTEPSKQARAMGVYGFVCSAGGSIGVLLGGVLTSTLGWPWIFFVNVPIGAVVILLSLRLLPADADPAGPGRRTLDVAGAFLVTAALLAAVFATIDGRAAGWTSARTLGLYAAAAALLAAFVAVERRVAEPLMALSLFARRNVAVADTVAVLWSAGMFAWFFIAALYLQLVLGLSALQVGLVFLAPNLLMAACSLGISAWLVERFGLRKPLAAGLLCGTAGLVLFARAPEQASIAVDVMPAMLLLGLAGGIAFNPLMLAATTDVDAGDAGLASGMVNTAFMMGGAVGLAVLASVAAAVTEGAAAGGAGESAGLLAGYRVAFGVAAAITFAGACLALALREPRTAPAPQADAA